MILEEIQLETPSFPQVLNFSKINHRATVHTNVLKLLINFLQFYCCQGKNACKTVK